MVELLVVIDLASDSQSRLFAVEAFCFCDACFSLVALARTRLRRRSSVAEANAANLLAFTIGVETRLAQS